MRIKISIYAFITFWVLPLALRAQAPDVTIGLVLDGPWKMNDRIVGLVRHEITDLMQGDFQIKFPAICGLHKNSTQKICVHPRNLRIT